MARHPYVRTRLPIVSLLVAATLLAASPSAKDLYKRAQKAEKAGRMTEAFLLYAQAAALAPANTGYWARAQAVRSSAEAEAAPAPPAADAPAAPPAAPAPVFAIPTSVPQLQVQPVLKDFDLRGDSKQLFEAVAKAWDLECVFDPEYQPVSPFRFRLTGVDYRQAFHGLELATGSFIVPISEKRFLVVKDTPPKRAEKEPVVEVGVELPAANQQDFQAMIAAVQQSMALEKVQWDTQRNMVFIRDRISKALPARDMFQNFMHPKGEIGVEMEFLEVSRNDAITYGVNFPTQFPLYALTNWFNNKPSISSAISGLLTFGGGKTLMGLGVINASLVATMSKSSGHVLLRSYMRSLDGLPATFHVGDRYPIITSSYSGSVTNDPTATYVPAPAINYEDLGFNLKLTPLLHDEDEVTLDIEADFKVLTGTAIDDIPVISNRQLKSRARLKIGDWAAVAGLLNSQEARTVAGMAGLTRIPALGPLFSTRDKNNSKQEVLILLRPMLLRPPASAARSYSFYLGSETRPITPL